MRLKDESLAFKRYLFFSEGKNVEPVEVRRFLLVDLVVCNIDGLSVLYGLRAMVFCHEGNVRNRVRHQREPVSFSG